MAKDTPAPRSPAPAVDPVFIWPTPLFADTLFYIEQNGDLPKNKTWAMGDPPANTAYYYTHKLVHVSPQTADKWSRWYYTRDRSNEDSYNFEFTSADMGGRRYDAVKRTYLTPRTSFDPDTPALGAAMPNTPSGMFAYASYVLAGVTEARTGDEIFDGLYVMEQRTYILRVPILAVVPDKMLGSLSFEQTNLYYKGESVADKASPTPGTAAIETYFDGTNDDFFGPQADGTTQRGEQISDNWYAVTTSATTPLDGWVDGASSATMVWHEYSTVALGGFKFDALETLWLMNRADHTVAAPTTGTELANADWPFSLAIGEAPATTGYIMLDRKQEWVSADFDKLYVMERRRYFARNQHYDVDFDEETSEHLSTFETLYYRGEVVSGVNAIEAVIEDETDTFWDIAAGVVRVGQTLTEDWFMVTSRQVMPTVYADGSSAYRDYYTTDNYSWPPVLEDVETMDYDLRPRGSETDGATRYYPRPIWKRYRHSGPTSMRIRDY